MTELDQGRERWVLEEQFVNNRLTWLGFTQTLLFGGYAVVLSLETPPPELSSLSRMIPVIGLATSLLILLGVVAAVLAMHKLKKVHGLDTYFVTRGTTLMGWTCSVGIPITFVASWVWLLAR